MHDLLRHLCIRKSNEDKFLHVKNGPKIRFSNTPCMSVHTSHGMEDVCASIKSMSLARSFTSIGRRHNGIPSRTLFVLRLIRVLNVIDLKFLNFPT